jgi:hypothetical protein
MFKKYVSITDQMTSAIRRDDRESIVALLNIQSKFTLGTFDQEKIRQIDRHYHQQQRISTGSARSTNILKLNMDSYINEPCSTGKQTTNSTIEFTALS